MIQHQALDLGAVRLIQCVGIKCRELFGEQRRIITLWWAVGHAFVTRKYTAFRMRIPLEWAAIYCTEEELLYIEG